MHFEILLNAHIFSDKVFPLPCFIVLSIFGVSCANRTTLLLGIYYACLFFFSRLYTLVGLSSPMSNGSDDRETFALLPGWGTSVRSLNIKYCVTRRFFYCTKGVRFSSVPNFLRASILNEFKYLSNTFSLRWTDSFLLYPVALVDHVGFQVLNQLHRIQAVMYYHFLCDWAQWAKVLLQMPVSMSSLVFLVPLSDLDNLLTCIRKYSFSLFRKEYYIIAMISSLGKLFL